MRYTIPLLTRTFKRVPPPANAEDLFKVFQAGGMEPEPECLAVDKKLTHVVKYVTSISNKADSGNFKYGFKQSSGNWVYCGNFYYIREHGGGYQFAQFLVYNSKLNDYIGLWKDEVLNEK